MNQVDLEPLEKVGKSYIQCFPIPVHEGILMNRKTIELLRVDSDGFQQPAEVIRSSFIHMMMATTIVLKFYSSVTFCQFS